MLQSLYIKNFILIKEIQLELSDNFNVFTGETGAGKSLFVDALGFVSGERSSSSVVGPNDDKAQVEAVFSLESSNLIERLKEMGLYDQEDDWIIFNREMNKNGRSVSRINGRIVNLKDVREVLALILDIHSQHDTHYLLDERRHLELLDSFINDDAKLNTYQSIYQEYLNKLAEIEDLENDRLSGDELEFSKFLLEEINELKPSIDDYKETDEKLKSLENFEKHKQTYNQIEDVLSNETNILGDLYNLMTHFSDIDSLNQRFKDVYYELEDIAHNVSRINNDFNFDEYEYQNLNERMSQYTTLIRKYSSIDGLISKKNELETKINNADYYDDILIDLQNDLKEIDQRLNKAANDLSKYRQDKAKGLEKLVIKNLNDLMLENAEFVLEFSKQDYRQNGIDKVKFLISLNKGIQPASLSKVASGGELSRVMLALKVIFSEIQNISTLIFDEIDTGVSGRVAVKIGEKMNDIAKTTQVISITHLPAVAACAKNHYLITKDELSDTNITDVLLIDGVDRIEHLALMMSGIINEDTKNAARKLLEKDFD